MTRVEHIRALAGQVRRLRAAGLGLTSAGLEAWDRFGDVAGHWTWRDGVYAWAFIAPGLAWRTYDAEVALEAWLRDE